VHIAIIMQKFLSR